MLGISVYPDKTLFEEDVEYLKLAHKLGYQRVFMSMLQIDINDPKKSIRRLRETISFAKELGMLVMLDIHPMVFDYLKMKEDDLSYFYDLGVDTLRLDSGYNGRIEAMMSYNSYGIKIDLNMSNNTHYLDLVLDYQPQIKNITASHNFYPQRYTGLSLESFIKCSSRFKKAHIHSAAFITSLKAAVCPWPVFDGTCTLEMHRDLPIDIQARHLKMLQLVDDLIIGNNYASKEELMIVKDIFDQPIDYLNVAFYENVTDLEKQIVCCVHDYRGDASQYMIRSSHNKQQYKNMEIKAHQEVRDIHRGDILILNEDYGQYKGEVQIALIDRIKDPRINVVGKIVEEEMILLDQLKPFQKFMLKEQ